MKLNKTREELVKMYIDSLNQGEIPWRKRWINSSNINGISKIEYRGVNQLILSLIAYKEKYEDNRWFTYLQIKKNGWKLENSKGKGVPIEFWSYYNIKTKQNVDFSEYKKIIDENPDEEKNFKVICRTSFVFNASLINGIPKQKRKLRNDIKISKYISNLFKKLDVSYEEHGNSSYYIPLEDKIVLPQKEKFIDEYSYYATQLHELAHSTGNEKRLNRNLLSNNKEDYAKEELVAEISSSFLMQKLDVPAKAEHYDNHKSYIQSWIKILKDKPQELFKAINESNKVYDYIESFEKVRKKELER